MSSFKAKLLNLKSQTQTSMDLGIDVAAGREMQGSLDDFRKAMKIRQVEMISSRNAKMQEQCVDRKITLSIRPSSLIAKSDRSRNKMIKNSEGRNDSSTVSYRNSGGSGSSSSCCRSSKDSGSVTNVDVIHQDVLSTDRNSNSGEHRLPTNDPKTGKSINKCMINNSVSTVECENNFGGKQIPSNDVSNSRSSNSGSSNSGSSSSNNGSRSTFYNKYSTENGTMSSNKNNEEINKDERTINGGCCRGHIGDGMRKNSCDTTRNINNSGESRQRSVTSGQNIKDSSTMNMKMNTNSSSNNSSSSSSSCNNSNNSNNNSSEYPSLDPQILQVMRPHQLQAAIFLLNVLMGRTSNSDDVTNMSKECAEEVRTHLISTAYGENVLVDKNKNRYRNGNGNGNGNENRNGNEAVRSVVDINKIDQNNDTKNIVKEHTQDNNSIPLTGAILADDMGTGKVRI